MLIYLARSLEKHSPLISGIESDSLACSMVINDIDIPELL